MKLFAAIALLGMPLTVAADTTIDVVPADAAPSAFFSGPIPRTAATAGDATLRDVASIGDRVWCVGDRGLMLASVDAGQTWAHAFIPFECSLNSVSFISATTGYVGGWRHDRFNRDVRGFVIRTDNGGRSWSFVAGGPNQPLLITEGSKTNSLPAVSEVKFFNSQQGVVVCRASGESSKSMLLRTSDGGQTWKAVSSDAARSDWLAGQFSSLNEGLVVGEQQGFAALVSNRLVTLGEPQRSARKMSAVSLRSDGRGWIVGSGASILQSESGGINWAVPAGELPADTADVFDFMAVADNGSIACAAGAPGSKLFRSQDGGASWVGVDLPGHVPVRGLHFVNESVLLAVGDLGIVYRSADAGATWQSVRSETHRAAVLTLNSSADENPNRLVATVGGDQGYRIVLAQPSASLQDTTAGRLISNAESRSLGANTFAGDWRFLRRQEDLEQNRTELLAEWGRQTDGRIAELLPQRLAVLLRTWRPDVVCVEGNDALADLITQAMESAIPIAAGTAEVPATTRLNAAGLTPWSVARFLRKLPAGRTSTIQFTDADLLSRLGTRTDLVTGAVSTSKANSTVDHYAAVFGTTPPRILAGHESSPGSANRRPIVMFEFNENVLRAQLQTAKTRDAAAGHLAKSQTPDSMIAQLETLTEGLPRNLALQQLQQLADRYAATENMDGRIAVLKQIVRRFPDDPRAADAADTLFTYFSSSELRLLRKRRNNRPDDSDIQQIKAITDAGGRIVTPGQQTPATEAFADANGSAGDDLQTRWNLHAASALKVLQGIAPERGTSPRILLRKAANQLRLREYSAHSQLLSQAAGQDGLFSFLASVEMQSVHANAAETPIPSLNVRQAIAKPYLDAVLDEPCWQSANEWRLEGEGQSGDALIMMCWDADHIYVAGRITRPDNQPVTFDPTIARRHDSDHQLRDRISLWLDTDRDYLTGFEFVIDDAGQTSERCCNHGRWNPNWFVAHDAEDNVWRFEAAIPVEEVLPKKLTAGTLWSVRLQRKIPGVLKQSLRNKRPSQFADRGYGLVRFIQAK